MNNSLKLKKFRSVLLLVSICLLVCFGLGACKKYSDVTGHKFTESTVKTPKGTKVDTHKYKDDLSKKEIEQANEWVKSMFPNVKKLREPTLKYNCHSYAWYSTATSNDHWMNNPSQYWTDKSYSQYANSTGAKPSNVTVNSKVVYWDKSELLHSAIVTSETKFTSKWGRGGLYEHLPTDCPYDSVMGAWILTFYK